MRSSRKRGFLSRVGITLLLVGLLFGGLPVGAQVSSGGWPDLGVGRLWSAVTGALSGALSPSVAEAAPVAKQSAGARKAAAARVQAAPAKPPKRVRESVGKRTASAKVFAMSDGTFEAEVFPKPVHYQDSAGSWREIDTTIAGSSKDGYAFASTRNGFVSRFGKSSENVARFELGGKRVALGLPGAGRALDPTVKGNTITYPDAVDGADLVYQVTPESLKEQIVLTEKPARAAEFVFTMRVAGVIARERADDAIAFFDKKHPDGPPAFVMPAPFMNDSADDAKAPHGKTFSDQVTQSVEQKGANFTITVKPDAGWLAAKEREYPVVIDPTIKVEPTPTQGKDAQVWSDTPDKNFGSDYRLSVGTDQYGTARSLLQFDTSFVPSGTAVDSATMRLYFDNDLYTNANDVTFKTNRLNAAWSEGTVTWNSIVGKSSAVGTPSVVKQANTSNIWHEFDVTAMASQWVSGSYPNNGVLVWPSGAAIGDGGAIYQAAEYAYNGEVENRPKLVLSYGRPSADLKYPTKIYSTGAELNWEPYPDPDPNNPDDDVVEYQVHRSVFQVFEPSASTLVAPLPPDATTFTDTTARPTPADDPDPFGKAYYYMIATKTRDGAVIAGSTQVSRLPKAGLTTQILHGSSRDTTLSSTKRTTNLDRFSGQKWLSAGINSSTYGVTRSILTFADVASKVPSGARIVDAEFGMWGFYSWGTGAEIKVHRLARGFAETEATWENATSTTAWTNAGGDYLSTAADSLDTVTNDPRWHWWDVGPEVQGWVDTPSTNHGLLVRLANTTVEQRVLFNSGEAAEPQLRPNLVVTYTEPTAESTYYAPDTPSVRMIPGDEYTIPVTLTNTTTSTWSAADYKLSYKWALPDGTDVTTAGNRLETALPADVPPMSTVTVQAKVKTPIQSAAGNKREQFVLNWDLRNTTTGTWFSATSGIPALPQNVTVEDPTSDELGLEKFYSYAGAPTGAGSNVLVNQYAGNTVFSYDAFSNSGRGLNSFLRMTYNSMDTSATSMGYGWSMAASGLLRLGTSLDLHPKGQDYPTTITVPDGDGTSHEFALNKNGSADPAVWTYDKPAGVHLHAQRSTGDDDSRRWVFTRPDRTKFSFDDEGWLTAIADRNGNTQTFTYTERKSNNQPRKFLAYVTDPSGRQVLTVDYYTKADTTNPKIIDNVKSVTDISGRTVSLSYSDKGLLTQMVDGSGDADAKTFGFTYDATQGNKNVKLVQVTDPRGNATDLTYFTAPEDPRDKWKLKTITDRLSDTTAFAYSDPDGTAGSDIESVVTDAEGNASTYRMDGFGRPTTSTNAKNETTSMTWDADNNVVELTEANGAKSEWRYDPKTGYPTSIRDAEAVKNNTAATVLGYRTGLNGYTADLTSKTSPEGRKWAFGYDSNGNLVTVTDPKGVGTPEVGDYQTRHTYDTHGQLLTSTDANGNVTTFADYHASGYPKTISDALGHATKSVYDARGNVTKATDAKGKSTTVAYDVFGRPGETVAPMDQANGRTITTPAPVYDLNDNVTKSTAPNGAVTTATYDAADQVTASTLPKDTATGPERKSTFRYDKVGNLLTETQPLGVASAETGDYVTTYAYDSIYQLLSVSNAKGDTISYSYDNVGNLTKVIDPRKNATTDTADFTATYTYDAAHRQKSSTDAEGNTSTVAYDRDGNVVSQTDVNGNTATHTLDERAMVTATTTPHKTGVTRTTKFAYDQAGNRTKVITPRGVATTDVADDFVHETVYDELNRPVERLSPYDPGDARYNSPDKTVYAYDAVGNLAKVSAPPSDGQSVRNDTTYSYFDNGWARSSTDPWDIVTTYDYNDLGLQTARTVTSAGGSSERTMSWSYFPDGKLRSRSDDGVPVGKHVALVDNSDTGNVATTGTWDTATAGSGFHGYDYRTTSAGLGSKEFTWTPVIPADGDYEVFVKYPAGVDGAATDAKYTVDDGSLLPPTRTVDQSTRGGDWVSIGSYALEEGNKATVSVSDQATGTVLADAVKLVRDTTGDLADTESKSFDYAYDLNGNLTSLSDGSSGAKVDSYAMSYDGLNQLSSVAEKLNGSVKNTTAMTYDSNGNTLTRDHDSQDAAYVYDARDLVSKVTNTRSGKSPKTTTYGYTTRGQVASTTKPNGNTVTYAYNLDGIVASQEETTTGGTLVARHALTYNANGHRVRDAAKLQNGDDSASYLDHVYEYGFDPQDRIATVTKRDAASNSIVSSESYTHDANANVIAQTINGTTTTFKYDRNRLLTAAADGTSASYNYDPFGRLNSVTSAGTVIESYTYDGFDRTAEHSKLNDSGALETTTYAYDPLDRTTAKTKSGKTSTFDYLGLSDKVVSEEIDGALSRSYTYNTWGQRLSQIKHDTTSGTEETSYYGYNLHSDVESLTGSDGATVGTYGYTAYGKDDETSFTGIDEPGAQQPGEEPYNVYRYQGKRWDPSSESYDMGFRDYSPGLNRFLTRDSYNGALADMGLGMDPWTGNRYAFTGGNPISRIEIDGHWWDWIEDTAEAVGDAAEAVGDGAAWVGEQAVGAVAGAADVVGETATGIWDALTVFTGCMNAVNSPSARSDCKSGMDSAAATAKAVTSDPVGAGGAIWDALTDPLVQAWEQGDYGYAIGRTLAAVGEIVLGSKGATALAKRADQKVSFNETGAGLGLLRDATIDGLQIRIKSGHGYRADHGSGSTDITSLLNQDDIDSTLAMDLASRIGGGASVTRAGSGHSTFRADVAGRTVEYRAVFVPAVGRYDISTYYIP